ncbi:hypothetical protein [Cognaticolwellia beringensis]|uniref:YtxH domain-containing protein n=1 Tax=Cognaticolwellia beringensis TaxID=1967665 RepID=A0A222G795_9GAMM|nr:hypothetical protein [Cognaticolwellia beringensis]ASP47755.1 hypothetical protein B5D82_08315 [Cognaticolwellia beringensis]|tara:strand:+ start:3005 stop:3253 length:249 start_codon:yes stop_codon:yes gene_type:complete
MTIIKKLSMTLITLVTVLGLAACSDDKAETAGEKVDEMVQDTGNAIEDAGDKAGDMATDAGNAIEDACEKVKEGVKAKDTDC